ncbi:MAG TPA: DEAD/DEAH box helicase [Candidatus Thermoplasmatota archaeon]|nr:DEAD/DEAH box helicase [Candidatus Thermoplasmatota archaeon]
MDRLDPRLAAWLRAAHGEPTAAQALAGPPILAGEHVLLSSPTGSGKTLAAFLPILSRLAQEPLGERTYCVYVSPLKALVNDMARNLARPIEGASLPLRVAVRTGDTTPSERQRLARSPPHILITTPESLALLLASPRSRAHLLGVRHVVVDEIHAIAESKRGAQLALTLERLAAYAGEFQRIGLSATVRPLEEVGRFLGGDRDVHVLEVEPTGRPELEVAMPAEDPMALPGSRLQESELDLVEREMARSRTLIVFTNTRAQAESLARGLKKRHRPDEIEELPPAEVEHVLPHHGSMSKASRLDVEQRLKDGRVRCVVASSSLELGIHVDHVDRVLLLGSPKGSARALQRVGRSGHQPGRTARATLLVRDPCDLPEAHAVQRLVHARRVEDIRIPSAPLDVLLQHLVAMRLELPLGPDAAFALTRRAHSYRSLSRRDFDAALAALPRVPRHEYLQNAGTIPETALLKVYHGDRYVGEVEEEFAARLHEGDVFLLAGRVWRFTGATPARVLVAPARLGEPTLPVWRGEGLAASPLLVEEVKSVLRHGSSEYPWMELQKRWAGHPCLDETLVESFPRPYHRALVFHAYLGRRANEALARALERRLPPEALSLDPSASRAVATDWGFALLVQRAWRPSRAALLRLLAEPIEPTLREWLAGSELLARRFRHVATRALVVRRRDGEGIGMRQRAADRLRQRLLDDHPIVREAYHECLREALDVDAAEEWRRDVVLGRAPLRLVDGRPCGSPLAERILSPPGEGRHAWLRECDDALKMYDSMLSAR